MDWPVVIAVLYLVLGAVLLWLATVILRENLRSRVNRVTALMLFFAGLGPIFAAVGSVLGPWQAAGANTPSLWFYNLFYVWEFFFPQLLLFSFVFPRERAWVGRHRWMRYALFVPHLVHVLWLTLWPRPDFGWMNIQTGSELFQILLAPLNIVLRFLAFGFTLIAEFHLKFFSVINLMYIIVAVWSLYHGFRVLTNPRLRDQVRTLITGILSGVGLYSVAFIAPTLGIFHLAEPLRVGLAVVALLVGTTAIAWSIIRYQFLDIRLFVRQSVVFTISTGLLVGLYLLLVTRVAALLKELLDVETPLIDVAFVVLVLIFFQPTKNRIDEWIARLFLRDEADPRAILESFSREIATVFDMEDLKKRVISVVTGQLFVERAFFAHRDSGGQHFTLELAGLQGEAIPGDDPFFTATAARGRPVAFEEFVIDQPLTAMTEVLSRWGCRLVVPVLDRGELTATLLLGDKISGYKYSAEDINLLATLANQMAVALTNVGLYQEALEKQRLEEEMNVARKIQMRLLPREPPCGETFQLAAFTQSSRQVGGDYYDFFELPPNRLGMVVADVSGKGLGAALLVSQLQAILRAEVRHARNIAELVANANTLLAGSTAADQYATLVYAEYNTATGMLAYSNAGHNYPIVARADGSTERLISGGLILGAFEEAVYEVGQLQLGVNDTVLFFTDGLSDLEDRRGNDFGEPRILEVLRANRHLSAEGIRNEFVREAMEFSKGQLGFDDLTLVVMKVVSQGDGRGMS